MSRKKITDEQLREAVSNSPSISHALRSLGLSPNGGTHGHYSKRIKDAGISTKHFLPNNNIYGIHRDKLKPEEILVKKPYGSSRTQRVHLLRALLEMGIEYKCAICGINNNWNEKELTLQIDHINGDRIDNSLKNLRFLCPNCHSQTETYGTKKPRRQCKKCKNYIQQNSKTGTCRSCYPRKNKINWPDNYTLFAMVEESSYTQVGLKLGVSDNAVRKRLKHSGVV